MNIRNNALLFLSLTRISNLQASFLFTHINKDLNTSEKQLATLTFHLFLIQEAVSYFGMLKQQLQMSI